ncbi:acyltransferase family protein [Hymenobacter baengnokdamensis]|uniref:acyltransferase family protein n=1 Tax=Hymenobacter baengnokdamensis TaxID=2615203 RepID=UPI00124872A4|nr:acyltransferase [Hymenobacter baengnokdamensis]
MSPAYTAPKHRIHFAGLNALRFAAALAIVVYHSTLGIQEGKPSALKLLLHNLTVGVDLFFIISGFLIIYLLLAEKANTLTISLKRFYLRRALRILPLYLLIVAIAYFQYHESNPGIDFSKYLYFWGNFWMIGKGDWTVAPLNPLWSLCIEEQFYLIVPLLIFLIPTKRLPALFIGIFLLSLSFRIYTALTVQADWMIIYCHTLSRCDMLALGGLLAYAHFKRPIVLSLPDWLLGIQLFVFIVLLSVLDTSNYETFTFATFKKYLIAWPLCFIFCFFVFNNSPFVKSLVKSSIIDYLGKISFGLYMYHSLVIDYLDRHNWHLPQSMEYGRPIVVFVLTAGVAAVSYELLEKQILKLKNRLEVIYTQPSEKALPEAD